jgi:hypothetical protein
MHLNISICWCTAFDSGSALQARRASANVELKRLMMRLLRCLCHTFAGVVQINILITRELDEGRQRRRVSGERRRSLGGRVRLQVLRVVLAVFAVAAWASGGAAANDKATMVPSTRAPDVADSLPWNWRDGSCNHCGNSHDGGYR